MLLLPLSISLRGSLEEGRCTCEGGGLGEGEAAGVEDLAAQGLRAAERAQPPRQLQRPLPRLRLRLHPAHSLSLPRPSPCSVALDVSAAPTRV